MNLPRLESLRNSLVDQGYSKAYAKQLVQELEDHYLSITDEYEYSPVPPDHHADHSAPRLAANQRLGSNQSILDAVRRQPDLHPWPKRHPWIPFLVAPAVLISLYTVATSWLAIYLFGPVPRFANPSWIQIFWLISLVTPILLVTSVVWFANRWRSGPWLPLGSTALISLGGFFVIDIVFCQQSQSSFCHLHWGFDPWQFMLPFGALGIGLVVTRWPPGGGRLLNRKAPTRWQTASRGGPLVKHLDEIAEVPAERRRLGQVLKAVPLIAGLLLMFWLLVSHAAERIRPHALDPIIASQQQPEFRAATQLDLLGQTPVRADLQLNEGQLSAIESSLQQYGQAKSRLWDRPSKDTSALSPPTPQAQQRFSQLSVEIVNQILGILNSQQRRRLVQLEYQQLGWDSLCLDEVRHELRLSFRQFQWFKDRKLKFNTDRSSLIRTWHKANPPTRSIIEDQLKQVAANYSSDLSAKLSPTQRNQLAELKGPPLQR